LPTNFLADVAVLPPAARLAAAALRTFARGSLLWMAAAVMLGDGALQSNTLVQIRTFVALFLAPEAAAVFLLRAFSARATVEGGVLVLARGTRRIELAVRDIVAVEAWRLPMPGHGVWLRLTSGERWRYGIANLDAAAFVQLLAVAGGVATLGGRPWATTYAHAALRIPRGTLDRPWVKFVLFPLVLAVPAFRLHQHIAYGSTWGEVYAFGLVAYMKGFALWWAAWAIGVALCAAVLRTLIEVGTVVAVSVRPEQAIDIRRWLERLALASLYLGLPAWLGFRIFGG
jgi:apolipoprotein N-acyltransferase